MFMMETVGCPLRLSTPGAGGQPRHLHSSSEDCVTELPTKKQKFCILAQSSFSPQFAYLCNGPPDREPYKVLGDAHKGLGVNEHVPKGTSVLVAEQVENATQPGSCSELLGRLYIKSTLGCEY